MCHHLTECLLLSLVPSGLFPFSMLFRNSFTNVLKTVAQSSPLCLGLTRGSSFLTTLWHWTPFSLNNTPINLHRLSQNVNENALPVSSAEAESRSENQVVLLTDTWLVIFLDMCLQGQEYRKSFHLQAMQFVSSLTDNRYLQTNLF